MSSNYQLAEKLLLSLRCSHCAGAGSTQYAASSPALTCHQCRGSGLNAVNSHKHAYIIKCIHGVVITGLSK